MDNASSEYELKQLLAEGKISESEYEELKKVMEEKRLDTAAKDDTSKDRSKEKMGKWALGLALAGIGLPFFCYFLVGLAVRQENVSVVIGPWFFLGLALEIAALVMGVIAWREALGKAGAIVAGVVMVLGVLFAR